MKGRFFLICGTKQGSQYKGEGLMNKNEKDNPAANQMMPRGALRAVREHLEDLRNSERKVAQYVLEAAAKVIYQCPLFQVDGAKGEGYEFK